MTTIKRGSFQRYGKRGWTWIQLCDGREHEMRTDCTGEGLFSRLYTGAWDQVLGACQYWMPQTYQAARRKRLRELDRIERGIYTI